MQRILPHPIVCALLGLLLSACSAQKRVWYVQDVTDATPEAIARIGQIRIKPLDRITVVVNSRNPELAVPFNSSTSYNSLAGIPATASAGQQALQVRTVDETGCLDFPIIGPVKCAGMTRSQLAREIACRIRSQGHIKDPSVNVQFADLKIAVIGEVARPGYYDIENDRVSIFDALAMAGDITVYGIRNDVVVTREENGLRSIEHLDLTSKRVFENPAFYLQQNDIVYVRPNKYKAQAGEISQNRSFYLSLIGAAVSVATLIVTLAK